MSGDLRSYRPREKVTLQQHQTIRVRFDPITTLTVSSSGVSNERRTRRRASTSRQARAAPVKPSRHSDHSLDDESLQIPNPESPIPSAGRMSDNEPMKR